MPIPFPFLDKTVKFPVARLSKQHFNEMGAILAVLPKGYLGKVKQDQQVILLNYGYKAGGIVRVFETLSVPGISPEALVRHINQDGFFHNVKRGDWQVKAMIVKGVVVGPTSDGKVGFDVAIQDLSGK